MPRASIDPSGRCPLKSHALLFSLLAAPLLASAAPAKTAPGAVALRGARLIDGQGGAPVEDSVVVIQDGRILAVGPASSTTVPAKARVVDYQGKTLIPGLISNHSHVGQTQDANMGAGNYTRANISRQLRQYEAYGITTVMALGLNGPLLQQLRTQQHTGRGPGADLFGADRGIGVPKGAPPTLGGRPVGEDQLARPETAEQARQAVRDMVARKTDVVKLWLDDFGGSLPVKMKPDIYQAVIDEAHQRGVRVAAHIHDLEDAKTIIRAGADIVAHGVRDQPVDAELIQLMKERSVWYVPTLSLDEATFIYADRPEWMAEPFFQRAVQPALRAQFADPAWAEKTRAEPKSEKARKDVAMNQRNLKALYDAGVRIGFGTDSGATPLRIPGVAEHRELVLMTEAGLTPLQALTLATREAATLLGLEDRGVLAPGKQADLVVLDGDPSTDISRTKTIHAVWHRGKQVSGTVDTFKP
ncbi:amidohydrolase family protein [Cystobacter ferrugineus]|uniref:amidohydrolase family protein n=1 Tax=Cystobacter ferrugineus TaxID=83449 RepID=UPI000A9B4E24|nr:amidohydrolase family protein [Cystobacter ferrugineus]